MMPPLSMLSTAGINVKSPFANSPHPLSPTRLFREDMTETQENLPPQDDSPDQFNTENQFTIKAPNSTRPLSAKLTLPTSPLSPSLQQTKDQSTSGRSASRSPERRVDSDVDRDIMDVSLAESSGFDPDNTCFSTFSAVPNVDMTNFARLGQNTGVISTLGREINTPSRSGRPETPGTAVPKRTTHSPPKSSSRSPTRARDDATMQLLEFTGRTDYKPSSTSRQTSPIRMRGQDLMAGSAQRMRSPEGRTLNLLDFDLPPAPTPRSAPSISARELEGLKAGFLSEISSLKAKLSGAQAEVTSLKEAKDDAESRVGKLSEELRDANSATIVLQQEKEDWQRHDGERRETITKLRAEYVSHTEEINRLREEAEEHNKRFQDMETRASDAEGRLQEAEGKLAGYREEANGDGTNPTTPGSNKAVEVAVEKVAKELHLLYKSKHEQKVAALKQSYEKRWKKKVDELAFQVEQLEKENAEIRTGRDATLSGEILPPNSTTPALNHDEDNAAKAQVLSQESENLRREVDELNKRMETMSRGVTMLERDNVSLRTELQESRKENSDLVAVVDEMLAIDLAPPDAATTSQPSPLEMVASVSDPVAPSMKTTTTTSKISGLRGPGFAGYGESRIGGGSMGLKRSVSGHSSRSGIMSNIERMGQGTRGRGGQE